MIELKTCNSCGAKKQANEFYKKLDGLASNCKDCQKQNKKKEYEQNKLKILERNKKTHQKMGNKRSEYMSNYRLSALQQMQQYNREYKKRNREKIRNYYRSRRDAELNCTNDFTASDAADVREKFKHSCFKCKISLAESLTKDKRGLVIDHHYPLASGCGLSLRNAVLLCLSCNSKKHKKMPDRFYSSEEIQELVKLGIAGAIEEITSREDVIDNREVDE